MAPDKCLQRSRSFVRDNDIISVPYEWSQNTSKWMRNLFVDLCAKIIKIEIDSSTIILENYLLKDVAAVS